MGAGLIYLALAVVWLVILVPWFASRGGAAEPDDADVTERFTRQMTLIQRSAGDDPAGRPQHPVSTPLTRRAERRDIARTARLVAIRTRRSLLGLLLVTLAAGVAAPLTSITWWQALVPAVLLVVFVPLSRVVTRSVQAQLDERLDALAPDWHDDTIVFEVPADLRTESTEVSIELSAPIMAGGSLWDPIPVTAPTYLAKPLVPRTVRTIDLSAPEPTVSVPRMPVVAEPLEPSDQRDEQDGQRRAVGE